MMPTFDGRRGAGVMERQAEGGGEAERFERPHAGLRDSYRSMVAEFEAAREPLVPFTLSFPHDDFDAFVARLAGCERGEGIPAGFVPHTTFWLVAGGEVVAVSNLRHRLTDKLRIEGGHIGYGVRPSARRRGHATAILRHTLAAARELGVTQALLTCAKANRASAATIRRCGGVLQSESYVEARGEVVQRWIIEAAAA